MRWILALTVSLTISTLSWAAEPASLATAGTVWANAVLLPSGTTLHEGDHVTTGRASTAVISSRSTGRVEVREQSAVSLGDGNVVLHKGVVATAKAPIRLDGIEIEPRGGKDALVVVAKRDGRMLIAAYRGEAIIHADGLTPVLVSSGQYAIPAASGGSGSRNGATKNAAGEKADKDDDDRDGTAIPAGSGTSSSSGGWTIGSLSHGNSVALAAGIGAAAVGGAVAGFALIGDSPSPSAQ